MAAACRVVPPLIAEKLILSLYVSAFVIAFRYFLRGVAPSREYWTGWVLLNVFNGPFWFGFYNYGISIVLMFVVMGYWIRQRDRCGFWSAIVLSLLLFATFYTHLLGYCLSVVALMVIALGNANCRPRSIVCVLMAIAVTTPVVAGYLLRSGFLEGSHGGFSILNEHFRHLLTDPMGVLERPILNLSSHLFGSGSLPAIGIAILLTQEFVLVATLLEQRKSSCGALVSVYPLACLGGFIAVMYFCLPDSLSSHGGFMQTRLACLPFLLWMACLSPPAVRSLESMVRFALPVLLAMNLISTTVSVLTANEELVEFVGGTSLAGHNHTVATKKVRTNRMHPNVLANAGAYYCLQNGNVWLDNYEAQTTHFPIRFKKEYPRQDLDAPELLLCWTDIADTPPPTEAGYRMLYHDRRMSVFRRADIRER